MSDIKKKIAKCLSLANSPEQEEAKAALLMARKLMVKHKLTMEEIKERETQELIKQLVNAHYTRMSDIWAGTLAKIIADHHCCVTYSAREYGGKTYTIGFAGFEDDFRVCQKVYQYAYDFVKVEADRIVKNTDLSNTDRRLAKNSYGMGFCRGLKEAYEEQDRKNEEWGLVLVTPEQVKVLLNDMKTISYNSRKHVSRNSELIHKGYEDGRRFNGGNRTGIEAKKYG